MSKNINLCVRGGGVKSATSIGVLKAFKEADINISRYSGTSIGAVITTLAALDTPVDTIFALIKRFVVEYSAANRLQGGKGSSVIESSMNEQCNNITLGEIDKPLYIAANMGGLWNTKPFIFSKETTPKVTVGEACRASCSFPIFYERYSLNISGKQYKFFDGGMVLNPYIPSSDNNEISVVVSFQKTKTNYKTRYLHAWLDAEKEADFLIKPFVGDMGTFGTPEDIENAMRLGYTETLGHIEELKKL